MVFHSVGVQTPLNKVKASGRCHRFSEDFIEPSSIKSGRKYAKAHLIDIGLNILRMAYLSSMVDECKKGI
ncbi:hypothetical protein [Siminovitchia terrae]|uniref:Uncharacterized protein n=1 Tax=Siminovitchia terrae TaxID=1914933 RepID=A0A429X0P1_SIMTE|nr:hypothetical protein [Siminovitchia terrae]RST56953.1 hypothetical protein D5F11_025360 [Siminovitchia terrae]